jgi:hypothetical protein
VEELGFEDFESLREVIDTIDDLASLPHMTVSMVHLESHNLDEFLYCAPPGAMRFVPELLELLQKLHLKGWLTSLEYVSSLSPLY